ncbi:MAG TPA: hypothetical protein VLT36_20070 [Candidatus Dormibacteraeota bacterium]|nr:hypothetical protein [Candidatus Dormibacteraeota bacterium]
MKTTFLILTGIALTASGWAQTSTNYYSTNQTSTTYGQQPVQGNINSFTNQAGTSFTVDQLANGIRDLKKAVDETLPALTAFNQTFSPSTASGHESIAGAISNLVSGALNKNSNQNNQAATSAQASAAVTALLTRLGSSDAQIANQTAPKDLTKLQSDLQPVAPLLSDLMGGTATAPGSSQVISSPRYPNYNSNQISRPLTPTGP